MAGGKSEFLSRLFGGTPYTAGWWWACSFLSRLFGGTQGHIHAANSLRLSKPPIRRNTHKHHRTDAGTVSKPPIRRNTHDDGPALACGFLSRLFGGTQRQRVSYPARAFLSRLFGGTPYTSANLIPPNISKPPIRRNTLVFFYHAKRLLSKPPIRRNTGRTYFSRMTSFSKPPIRRNTNFHRIISNHIISKPPIRRNTLRASEGYSRKFSKPPIRRNTAQIRPYILQNKGFWRI